MQANTFDKQTGEKAERILEFAINNRFSDFYRRKYDGLDISKIASYDDFTRIPLLTKDEVLSRSVGERVFVPEEKIVYYSFTSGTTSHNKPTIVPHSAPSVDVEASPWEYNEDEMKRYGAEKIMVLYSPIAAPFVKYLSRPKKYTQSVAGDINNLPLTARIMKEVGVNGITTIPAALNALIAELEKIGFDLNAMKWIYLGAEFTSMQRHGYFKSRFPNAFINYRYGNSEFGGFKGYRCEHLAEKYPPNVFHPTTRALFEILDDNGDPLPFGEDGELVTTDLYEKALPFIRYKSGDIGRLEKTVCACGSPYLLSLSGKSGLDFMRLHGATLHSQAIENSLEGLSEFIEPKYRMHVWEKTVKSQVKPLLKLELMLKPGYSHLAGDANFKDELAGKIGSKLAIARQKTLKDFIDKGSFLSLSVEFVEKIEENGLKEKRIISHLS